MALVAPPQAVSLPARAPLAPPAVSVEAPVLPAAWPLTPLAAPGAAPLLLPLSASAVARAGAAAASPAAASARGSLGALASGLARAEGPGRAGAAAGADAARAALDRGFDAASPSEGAAAPVELVREEAPAPLAKTGFARALESGRLAYGAELGSANPVSAKSLAGHRALASLVVDAAGAERGELAAVVRAVQHLPTVVLGRFASADDPFLKPKLDEGLSGALLKNAGSLRQTLRFLDRVYLPPLGRRSVGPSDVTEYLSRTGEFLEGANPAFVGGVTIGDARGVGNIGSIVKAKARGLRLIEVDAAGIARSLGVAEGSAEHRAAVERVEAAARAAGIPLSGRAASRAEALALHARGYRHVVVAGDAELVDESLRRFEDAAFDRAQEAPRGMPPREWLRAGLTGFLGFLNTPDEALARVLAARTNALWIDAEAGQFPLERIARVIRALPAGRRAVVRTTQADNPDIEAYLAMGAAGVVAPQVGSAREARRFVARVKSADPDALAIVMIETRRGLEHAEEIARVPGVDVLFVGPHDLSLSMGVGKDDPRFAAALARIEAAARAAGVPMGGLASSRAQGYAMRPRGYRFLATVMEQAALIARLRARLAAAAN